MLKLVRIKVTEKDKIKGIELKNISLLELNTIILRHREQYTVIDITIYN